MSRKRRGLNSSKLMEEKSDSLQLPPIDGAIGIDTGQIEEGESAKDIQGIVGSRRNSLFYDSDIDGGPDGKRRKPNYFTPHTPRSLYNRRKRACHTLTLNMVMTLDVRQIQAIREDFNKHEDSEVSMPQFVAIMRKHLNFDELNVNKDKIVRALVELFDSMDLDGDKALDFQEFLATVVHMGMGAADHLVMDPIKEYKEGQKFKISKLHSEQHMKYVPGLDRVMISEVANRVIKIYDPVTMKVRRSFPIGQAALLAFEYIPINPRDFEDKNRMDHYGAAATADAFAAMIQEQNINADGTSSKKAKHDQDDKGLIVAATAQHLYLWEGIHSGSGILMLTDAKPLSKPVTVLKWIPETKSLYSGNMQGLVHSWKIIRPKDSEKQRAKNERNDLLQLKLTCNYRLSKTATFRGHTDVVTSICNIPSMDLLLTASLDGTIRMWDLVRGNCKLKFLGHRAGVVGLDYSNEYRFLLSAGIDHDVLVWSPFADRLVYKLTGHSAPLIGVQFVHGTPQIVTADSDGWVKIWDARNFSCVQTFLSMTSITTFATVGNYHRRIFVAGRHHNIFSYDQVGGPYVKMGEQDAVFLADFNPVSMTMLTVGTEEVKLWNALTGGLLCIFRGLSESEITAVCMDGRKRKLIVGDHAGNIRVYNYLTGAYMKSLASHDGEISYLGYNTETKTVISASRDQFIKIHDERPIDDPHVLVKMRLPAPDADITCTEFSHKWSSLGVASSEGCIYMWNLETGVREGVCLGGHGDLVLCMLYMKRYPLLIASDESGQVVFWFIRPSPYQFYPAIKFTNLWASPYDETKLLAAPVTSLCMNDDETLLWTGDTKGNIHRWDLNFILSPVMERLGERGLSSNQHLKKLQAHQEPKKAAAAAADASAIENADPDHSSSSSSASSGTSGGENSSSNSSGSSSSSNSSSRSSSSSSPSQNTSAANFPSLSSTSSPSDSTGPPELKAEASTQPLPVDLSGLDQNGAGLLKLDGMPALGALGQKRNIRYFRLAAKASYVIRNLRPVHHVQAHAGSISSLKYINHPESVLSSARSHICKIWDLDGQSLGTMDSIKALSVLDVSPEDAHGAEPDNNNNNNKTNNNHTNNNVNSTNSAQNQKNNTDDKDDNVENKKDGGDDEKSDASRPNSKGRPKLRPSPAMRNTDWMFFFDVQTRHKKESAMAKDILKAVTCNDDQAECLDRLALYDLEYEPVEHRRLLKSAACDSDSIYGERGKRDPELELSMRVRQRAAAYRKEQEFKNGGKKKNENKTAEEIAAAAAAAAEQEEKELEKQVKRSRRKKVVINDGFTGMNGKSLAQTASFLRRLDNVNSRRSGLRRYKMMKKRQKILYGKMYERVRKDAEEKDARRRIQMIQERQEAELKAKEQAAKEAGRAFNLEAAMADVAAAALNNNNNNNNNAGESDTMDQRNEIQSKLSPSISSVSGTGSSNNQAALNPSSASSLMVLASQSGEPSHREHSEQSSSSTINSHQQEDKQGGKEKKENQPRKSINKRMRPSASEPQLITPRQETTFAGSVSVVGGDPKRSSLGGTSADHFRSHNVSADTANQQQGADTNDDDADDDDSNNNNRRRGSHSLSRSQTRADLRSSRSRREPQSGQSQRFQRFQRSQTAGRLRRGGAVKRRGGNRSRQRPHYQSGLINPAWEMKDRDNIESAVSLSHFSASASSNGVVRIKNRKYRSQDEIVSEQLNRTLRGKKSRQAAAELEECLNRVIPKKNEKFGLKRSQLMKKRVAKERALIQKELYRKYGAMTQVKLERKNKRMF